MPFYLPVEIFKKILGYQNEMFFFSKQQKFVDLRPLHLVVKHKSAQNVRIYKAVFKNSTKVSLVGFASKSII